MTSDSNPQRRADLLVCFLRTLRPHSELRRRLEDVGAVIVEKHPDVPFVHALETSAGLTQAEGLKRFQRIVLVVIHTRELEFFRGDEDLCALATQARIVSGNTQVGKELSAMGYRIDAQSFEPSEVALYIAVQSLL